MNTDKEVLHTQRGELNGLIDRVGFLISVLPKDSDYPDSDAAEQVNDAIKWTQKAITKALTERQRLLDSNKELLETLKWVSKVTNSPEIGIRCDKTIHNAKNNIV